MAGSITREEFVAGYRSYLDKVKGKPQVVFERGDWRVWNALDLHDEVARHNLAQFYHRLEEEFGDPAAEETAPSGPVQAAELSIPQDYAGIILSDPLAPGSGADLLQRCAAPLARGPGGLP